MVQPILLGVGDAGDRLLQGRQQGLHSLTNFFIENFFGGPHRRLATFLFRSPSDRLGLLLASAKICADCNRTCSK